MKSLLILNIVFLILGTLVYGDEENTCSNINSEISTLKLLQVVHRHGDRSPTHSYPSDPYRTYWPQGLGQLTKVGKQQAFDLGNFLRHCYAGFLGKIYRRFETRVRSTNWDRTLMTAQCVLAGLFPVTEPKDNTTAVPWSFGSWQPIPIQTVDRSKDKLLSTSSACTYVHQLRSGKQAQQSMELGLINNKEMMMELSEKTGLDINISTLHALSDIVYVQTQHSLTQPQWMKPEFLDKLLDYYQQRPVFDPEDAKYMSGNLLKAILGNMMAKAENQKDFRKLFLYSGHDSTVHPLMSLLGVANGLQIPYAGAFIIELHKTENGHFVRLLYTSTKIWHQSAPS